MNMQDRNPIEWDLFRWEGWDEVDTGSLMFYKCTLLQPIGDFPAGTVIPHIIMDCQRSYLCLSPDSKEETDVYFAISLNIGEKL